MSDPAADARSILDSLQAAVDSRDSEALLALFDDPAVLIGTSGDGRTRDDVHEYLKAVVTGPGSFRWEWTEIVPVHRSGDTLAFAAFGDVVVSDEGGEHRAPIRVSVLAVAGPQGWKLRQFHGSIPSNFS